MGLLNLAHAASHFHREEKVLEGSIQNGSMSLANGLNTVSPRIKHNVVFAVFCLEKRRMTGIKHLWLMVGMYFIEKNRLKLHVGDVNGAHYQAMKSCDALLQTEQHIDVAFNIIS